MQSIIFYVLAFCVYQQDGTILDTKIIKITLHFKFRRLQYKKLQGVPTFIKFFQLLFSTLTLCSVWDKGTQWNDILSKDGCLRRLKLEIFFEKFKSVKRIRHRCSSLEINWSLKAIKEWTSLHRLARLLLHLLPFYSTHPAGVCFTKRSTKLPSTVPSTSKISKSIAK